MGPEDMACLREWAARRQFFGHRPIRMIPYESNGEA
jgi:hypothetical protein